MKSKAANTGTDNNAGGEEFPANSENPKDTENLANLFEYLDVEDPAEWTSGALPSKSTKSSKKSNLTYELEDSDEDKSFAIFCLFKDLTDIRHFVRQTWAEYREKQLAFTTAAVTMNTAIAMMRRLNEDFVQSFPEFEQHHNVLDYLYNGYCDPQNGFGDDFATYSTVNFRVPSKILFCDHTFELFSRFFLASEAPFFQQDRAHNFTLDEEALFKCLSLFGFLICRYPGAFPQDQLMKGLELTKKDNKVYTWVVLAVQLLIDTRRVVGAQGLDRFMEEFHSTEKWLSSTIKQCLRFGETNEVNTWFKINDPALRQLGKQVDEILRRDTLQEDLDMCFGDGGAKYSWGPFFLFRNHPTLAGLLVENVLMRLHSLGIGLCGDQGAVMTSIHLYSAVHEYGFGVKIPSMSLITSVSLIST